MPPRAVILCAQCGAVAETEPVALGDELFCCLGCVGGGACICERQDQDVLALRVGPFASQADVLRFAASIERAPGLLQVEMTESDPREARFNVVAPSPDVLALAVEANNEFTITIETNGSTVYGRVAPPRRRTGAGSGATDEMLPTRTRFRVFRPTSSAESDTPLDEPTAPPRLTGPSEAQVADLLANARAAASIRAFAPEPPAVRPRGGDTSQPAPVQAAATTISIVGAPFSSFIALNEFQGVVRALPGVRDTRVRRFYGGTLNLAVDYEDGVPLVERLQVAADGSWVITAATPDRVEIRVVSGGSLAPNRSVS